MSAGELAHTSALAIPGTVRPTALTLPPDLTLNEWLRCGELLARISAGVQWWVGDWLVYGEERCWGEKYSQALDETQYEYGTLADASWVSRHVEFSVRTEKLSWNHHRVVAKLEPEAQKRWLDRAIEGDDGQQWSYRRLRAEIGRKALEAAPWPDRTYRVIYADPPWEYTSSGLDQYGPAERHYPTMKTEDIASLSVQDIAGKDSVLFLWTTSPMLPDALEVIEAWGFEYKSSFIWDKVGHNYGHYNSVRHELLLVATKGSCLPDNEELYDSVITIDKSTIHSEKPAHFRQMIDDLYTWGPRVELFLRGKPAKGWEAWGNEVEGAA